MNFQYETERLNIRILLPILPEKRWNFTKITALLLKSTMVKNRKIFILYHTKRASFSANIR